MRADLQIRKSEASIGEQSMPSTQRSRTANLMRDINVLSMRRRKVQIGYRTIL